MSNFISLIGDNDGPLTYTGVNDQGTFQVTRTSEDIATGDQDIIIKRFSKLFDARLALYKMKVKVEATKAAAEKRVLECDREINAIDELLQGWTPPPEGDL